MHINGKIIEINDTQQVSDTFKKRAFVVEYIENPQYPELISFELIQDKCDILNTFQVGQEVVVHFNLRGRKWVNPEGVARYFNSLQAWRIESVDTTGTTSAQFDSQEATNHTNSSSTYNIFELSFL